MIANCSQIYTEAGKIASFGDFHGHLPESVPIIAPAEHPFEKVV